MTRASKLRARKPPVASLLEYYKRHSFPFSFNEEGIELFKEVLSNPEYYLSEFERCESRRDTSQECREIYRYKEATRRALEIIKRIYEEYGKDIIIKELADVTYPQTFRAYASGPYEMTFRGRTITAYDEYSIARALHEYYEKMRKLHELVKEKVPRDSSASQSPRQNQSSNQTSSQPSSGIGGREYIRKVIKAW